MAQGSIADKASGSYCRRAGGARSPRSTSSRQLDPLRLRALSRRRAGHAGSGRRPGGYHARSGRQRQRPGPQRHDQGLCRPDQGPMAGAARCSIDRRGGRAVPLRLVLARLVAPKGRRRISSPSSARWSSMPWPMRRYGSALPISARRSWPRYRQTPEALAAHHNAETEK